MHEPSREPDALHNIFAIVKCKVPRASLAEPAFPFAAFALRVQSVFARASRAPTRARVEGSAVAKREEEDEREGGRLDASKASFCLLM